jgi:hypothetical protein
MTILSISAFASDATYDSLSSSGRPQNFYRLSGLDAATPPEQCRKLAAALNEAYPHGTYDLKTVLLFNKYAAHWDEQSIFRSSPFIGSVLTFTSSGPSPISFLLHTYDAKDNPVDELYQIALDDLDAVRREDGKLDATRLKALIRDYRDSGKWLIPRMEWMKDHQNQSADGEYSGFASTYHWADVVVVDDRVYALFASPPGFGGQLKLRGVLGMYLAPVNSNGVGPGDCRFTHS